MLQLNQHLAKEFNETGSLEPKRSLLVVVDQDFKGSDGPFGLLDASTYVRMWRAFRPIPRLMLRHLGTVDGVAHRQDGVARSDFVEEKTKLLLIAGWNFTISESFDDLLFKLVWNKLLAFYHPC